MSANNSNPSYQQLMEAFLTKKTWEDFWRTPCVNQSFLWGLGCASIVVAHKLRLYKGQVKHALNAATLTFGVVASGNFFICTQEATMRHNLIKKSFTEKNIKEAPDNKPPGP